MNKKDYTAVLWVDGDSDEESARNQPFPTWLKIAHKETDYTPFNNNIKYYILSEDEYTKYKKVVHGKNFHNNLEKLLEEKE